MVSVFGLRFANRAYNYFSNLFKKDMNHLPIDIICLCINLTCLLCSIKMRDKYFFIFCVFGVLYAEFLTVFDFLKFINF